MGVDALAALGAKASEPASLLSTFSRHAPSIERIASSRTERLGCTEVTIDASDITRPASARTSGSLGPTQR